MARFPTTAAALRTVVNADNALAASHLDTLSGTTASADELNLLDGLSAAGNATASKAVVADTNKAVIGLRRKVTADADGMADAGEVKKK